MFNKAAWMGRFGDLGGHLHRAIYNFVRWQLPLLEAPDDYTEDFDPSAENGFVIVAELLSRAGRLTPQISQQIEDYIAGMATRRCVVPNGGTFSFQTMVAVFGGELGTNLHLTIYNFVRSQLPLLEAPDDYASDFDPSEENVLVIVAKLLSETGQITPVIAQQVEDYIADMAILVI